MSYENIERIKIDESMLRGFFLTMTQALDKNGKVNRVVFIKSHKLEQISLMLIKRTTALQAEVSFSKSSIYKYDSKEDLLYDINRFTDKDKQVKLEEKHLLALDGLYNILGKISSFKSLITEQSLGDYSSIKEIFLDWKIFNEKNLQELKIKETLFEEIKADVHALTPGTIRNLLDITQIFSKVIAQKDEIYEERRKTELIFLKSKFEQNIEKTIYDYGELVKKVSNGSGSQVQFDDLINHISKRMFNIKLTEFMEFDDIFKSKTNGIDKEQYLFNIKNENEQINNISELAILELIENLKISFDWDEMFNLNNKQKEILMDFLDTKIPITIKDQIHEQYDINSENINNRHLYFILEDIVLPVRREKALNKKIENDNIAKAITRKKL